MKTYSTIDVFTGRAHGLTEPASIGMGYGPTRGHAASEPGLRGHSIGDTFPWRVVGLGNGAWQVEGVHGQVAAYFAHGTPWVATSDDACACAHRAAKVLKTLHPAGDWTPPTDPRD
jgi:hypothetical protein